MTTMIRGGKTVEDWLATPETQHWELIDGDLVMTEESYWNTRLAGEIVRRIGNYLEQNPIGIAERDLAFAFLSVRGDKHVVVPDLCFLSSRELLKIDPRANLQKGVTPALVAEMLSPSTRKIDLEGKVEIYREAGVSEYWVFDQDEESVRIYRFEGNRDKPVAVKSFAETLTTPLLPGFLLEMAEMRRRIDPTQDWRRRA